MWPNRCIREHNLIYLCCFQQNCFASNWNHPKGSKSASENPQPMHVFHSNLLLIRCKKNLTKTPPVRCSSSSSRSCSCARCHCRSCIGVVGSGGDCVQYGCPLVLLGPSLTEMAPKSHPYQVFQTHFLVFCSNRENLPFLHLLMGRRLPHENRHFVRDEVKDRPF